ncbi:FxSxx-COOH system tetratricopeptide repeat protein [Actinoplanes derwentensis]|uniref:NB-ARC domain-containing protein n=1 Tax=Actinoplanes derwentensis TaxID=113562 RepID=A0A1H1WZ95_9ACTN|nr:FxSxx-COOH system tetratricopeptide repeat protein [Actinoplanes derwentensis]GID85780.1 ATP-binding protein [Actinoplanes derwentensis]SDT02131.1 NB-ARC domain-containing protein [Actinoplanes derwentensis]
MPIALPGPDALPEGPRRDLVVRLHTLYRQAGRPATRNISRRIETDRSLETVSHETINSILRAKNKNAPTWNKLKPIIITLCRMSENQVDSSRELVECLALWNQIEEPQSEPETVPERDAGAPDNERPVVVRPVPRRYAVVPVESRLHGALPARSPLFTGREQTLDEIEHRLSRSPEALLVLHGPIGAGKTQTAAEYVRQHHNAYAITWWVPAGTVEQARQSLLRLADALEIPADDSPRRRLDELFDELARSRSYLLVFDGVLSADLRTLARAKNGHVIVTARNPNWAQGSPPDALEIPDLDEGEAAQLLRKRDPRITVAQIAAVAAVAGRTPFGLAEACRLHRELNCDWAELAQRLADPENRILTGPGRTSRPAIETVRSVLQERLASEPYLLPLLTLLLGFGPSPVWVWMLRRGMDGDISPGTRHLLADPARIRHGMATLAAIGLARRHPDGDWARIPELVRLVLRELIGSSREDATRRDVVEILLRADPARPADRGSWELHQAITAHLGPAGLLDSMRPPAYRTVHHQLRFLYLTGKLHDAQRLGHDAEKALARPGAPVPASGVVLLIKRDLANALRADGRYREASRLTEAATALVRDDPEDTEDRAIVLDLARDRGHDLRIAGDYANAYDHDEDTQERHRAAFADDDPRLLASRDNLSVSRRFLGKYLDAEAADRADLERPGDHPRRRARVANALAEDLYGLGRFAELVESVAPITVSEPGREPHRARRITGVALRRLGRLLPAVDQLGACYQACMDQWGERHELTLVVCMSFANALRARGQFASALHYCLLAEQGYRSALGADHPLVHVARVNTAAVHLIRDDRAAAAQIINPAYDALAGLVGAGHPFTVLAGVNRAFAASISEPEPVWSWPRTAYEQARDTFGADHLDTLLAGAGFAATRAARDEEDGLAPGLDQILSALRRRFGSGHEVVARVAGGLPLAVDIEVPTA